MTEPNSLIDNANYQSGFFFLIQSKSMIKEQFMIQKPKSGLPPWRQSAFILISSGLFFDVSLIVSARQIVIRNLVEVS
jgi:hypothetical protein